MVRSSRKAGRFPDIGDYAVIGDCRAAALISKDGSMDWLCWPRFDSAAIFAAMLDAGKGGSWRIHPIGEYRSSRSYVCDTNVLQTTFTTRTGKVTLTDLMPVTSEETNRRSMLPDHEIIRQLECTAGEGEIEVVFDPRSQYGESPVTLREHGKLGIRADVGKGVYWLRSTHPLTLADDCAA